MEKIHVKVTQIAYIDLKKKWTTSLQALGYRAANLGIIDSKSHRIFYAAPIEKDIYKESL